MSNAASMTLEERIVQKLKSDTLMQLVGDEDAITKLVERALHEALFKERKVDSYGRTEPSPVVKAADPIARSMVQTIADKIIERDDVRKVILDALLTALPKAIEDRASNLVWGVMQQSAGMAIAEITNKLRDRGITV